MTEEKLSKKTFLFLLGLVILLNMTCLFNEILEPDGTLYAGLAKQIVKSGNWLFLTANGTDWLDKPHLPFWIAAVSFKLFGFSAFAYKLPSFIFFIVALFYCFRLTAAIFTKETARLSTLIFGTALHIIISNFDGKVEIYLTAFVIAAMYHIYRAFDQKWFWHVVAAAFFAACAVMTKGIFALVTIAIGFVVYWIKTKQWAAFIQLKWYFFILLVFIFILPEIYSLYVQFDLHPEKIVFGKTHVSGLRFFIWDSQFGRFFNSGPIKGTGDFSFFLHTTLWAYLPWSIVLLLAIINLFKRAKETDNKRWIIGSSALFSFIMFSLSKFQLPHYILILFPHFSIITSAYLIEKASDNTLKKINVFQTIFFALIIAAVALIIYLYSFEDVVWFLIIMLIIAAVTFFYKPGNILLSVVKKNTGIALLIALFLNCLFYPSLLKYQSGMMAAKWLNKEEPTTITKVVLYKKDISSGFDFYYNGKIDYADPASLAVNSNTVKDSVFLYSAMHELRDINADSFNVAVLKRFPFFHVSQVNGKFVNYKTRKEVLDTFAIALVTPKYQTK